MPEKTADLPAWLVDLFPPDRRIAVEFFRKLVDESMLLEIANACYGMEVEEQLASLMPIWNGEDWAELDCWFPMEALELMRWAKPEDPAWAPGCAGLRGYQIRAFSCAVLLATPNFDPDNQTLIQMLDSAFVIGGEAPEAVARFLTWKIPLLERGADDRPFFALALAAIATIDKKDLSSDKEISLANWLEEEEANEKKRLTYNPIYEHFPWLLGLTWRDIKVDRWLALIQKLQCDYQGSPIEQMLTRCIGANPVTEGPTASS